MGSIYILMAGLLLYFIAVRMVALSKMSAITASCLVVIGYFMLTTLVGVINYSAYDVPLSQLFGVAQFITVLIQFIIAFVVFSKIQVDDDSYTAPLIFGAMGCIGIFFVIPSVVAMMR